MHPMRYTSKIFSQVFVVLVLGLIGVSLAIAQQNPLSAKVEITSLQNYTGGQSLAKPTKILVYDFAINTADVQVDKTQEFRLRHLIRGDENATKAGEDAVEELAKELVESLKKTGIPVERVGESVTPGANTLAIRGTFLDVKEGEKTERVAVGMGAGSAEVQTKVDVHYKTPTDSVVFSAFQTDTTLSKNIGAGAPIAAGMNPAAAGARATVGDRKKNVHAYAEKTADAIAKQVAESMAGMGWIAGTK
jgi:hypothetical protein